MGQGIQIERIRLTWLVRYRYHNMGQFRNLQIVSKKDFATACKLQLYRCRLELQKVRNEKKEQIKALTKTDMCTAMRCTHGAYTPMSGKDK